MRSTHDRFGRTLTLAVMGLGGAAHGQDTAGAIPDELTLTAVIRDFPPSHPDFQAFTGNTTVGLVNPILGEDGLPAMQSLRGYKINREFKDSDGRNINPALYDPELGDVAGELENGSSGNGLASESSFREWYRDVPGANLTMTIPVVLQRIPNTDRYVFDSAQHEPYASRGGFFPIDGEGYGNYTGWDHNFHFTTVIETEFTYNPHENPTFKFTGDDDVWVYIGERLVIDLGGLHPRREQFLELSRLDWLEAGETYPLRIFHAERRTSQSNFRMETTLRLRKYGVDQVVTVPFD